MRDVRKVEVLEGTAGAETSQVKDWPSAKPGNSTDEDVPNETITALELGLVFEPDAETRALGSKDVTERTGYAQVTEERKASEDKNGESGQKSNGWKPRKRRKIRSRQKNLKRDKRAKDKLPSHLTEETLRGGRLQPRVSG